MATSSLADYAVTDAWTDLVATIGAAASVDVLLQNLTSSVVMVVSGGGSAPASTISGVALSQFDSFKANAANIWVRTGDPDGAKLSVTTV